MLTDFTGNDLFLVFSGSPAIGPPATRVLGPYRLVEFRAKGIWASGGSGPVRVASQDLDSLAWELDGLEDHLWGDVSVIAPPRKMTAREIEDGTDWIRPG
jgi:hypothetical protein